MPSVLLHLHGRPAIAAAWPCLPAVGTYVNQGGLWVVSAVVLTSEAVEVYAVAKREHLKAKLAELEAESLAAENERRRPDSIVDEAQRLVRGEPAAAPAPRNFGRECAVLQAAVDFAERDLRCAIVQASGEEIQRGRPAHNELVQGIDRALDGLLSAVANERQFRNDLSARGFSPDALLEPFGGEGTALGLALRRLNYDAWRERLVRHGAKLN